MYLWLNSSLKRVTFGIEYSTYSRVMRKWSDLVKPVSVDVPSPFSSGSSACLVLPRYACQYLTHKCAHMLRCFVGTKLWYGSTYTREYAVLFSYPSAIRWPRYDGGWSGTLVHITPERRRAGSDVRDAILVNALFRFRLGESQQRYPTSRYSAFVISHVKSAPVHQLADRVAILMIYSPHIEPPKMLGLGNSSTQIFQSWNEFPNNSLSNCPKRENKMSAVRLHFLLNVIHTNGRWRPYASESYTTYVEACPRLILEWAFSLPLSNRNWMLFLSRNE